MFFFKLIVTFIVLGIWAGTWVSVMNFIDKGISAKEWEGIIAMAICPWIFILTPLVCLGLWLT